MTREQRKTLVYLDILLKIAKYLDGRDMHLLVHDPSVNFTCGAGSTSAAVPPVITTMKTRRTTKLNSLPYCKRRWANRYSARTSPALRQLWLN